MRNPLKRLAQRGTPKLTMRERATLLKASAARVIRRRPAVHPTDQPSGETLLANTVLDRGDDGFRNENLLSHERGEGAAEGTTRDGAGKNGASRSETDMGRHETFDTAIPLAVELLSGTALPGVASVHATIRAHRDAYAEWSRLASIYNELPPSSPEFIAAYAKADEPGKRETAAFEALLSTKATTVEGLRLLIDYLPTATRQVTIDNGDSDEQRALDLIRSSFLGLEDAQRLVSEPRHVVKLPPVADLLSDAILKEWAAQAALPDDETPESEAADERALDRRHRLIAAAERLPARRESLTAKTLALAWISYAHLWRRGWKRSDYTTDGRLALDIDAIATNSAPLEAVSDPDPIHAAIAASRAAEAEMKAFGKRPDTKKMTRALFREEDRLCEIQTRTRDVALSTVPTTQAGQIALADYVRFQMDLFGMADGSPPDDDSQIWSETHRALLAALAAPVDRPAKAAGPDLSGATLAQLGRLYETAASIWRHASAETQSPCFWDEKGENHNIAGRVLDAEADRLSELLTTIEREAKSRSPKNDRDRDERLNALVLHELQCNGRFHDRGLMAEIAKAWGA